MVHRPRRYRIGPQKLESLTPQIRTTGSRRRVESKIGIDSPNWLGPLAGKFLTVELEREGLFRDRMSFQPFAKYKLLSPGSFLTPDSIRVRLLDLPVWRRAFRERGTGLVKIQ